MRSNLQFSVQLAELGRFSDFLISLDCEVSKNFTDVQTLFEIGLIYKNYGFLDHARQCFEQAMALEPDDIRSSICLAVVVFQMGRHATAAKAYRELLKRLPDDPVVRRNALTSVEYDPAVSDEERFAQAMAWGKWAKFRAHCSGTIPQAETFQPVPEYRPDRPLRVGFVGPDFCQHTVGLLVKDTLKAFNRSRVEPILYYAGTVNDWVTEELRRCFTLRDVSSLDDSALAALIQQDAIDVLVDLSGHTAGSRLTVFAYRPAPVQVSWLGYFATTGLDTIDAVLLDPVHAPPGTEAQFVEAIVRLPHTRWCYQPVPFAPTVAPLPADRNGFITFGSFNNTAKYHPVVHELWAKLLLAVPNSRLILKWRTFHDEVFSASVLSQYTAQGIDASRVELRGPSFHAQVLEQYGDVDIALDPFPFSGGLTSCEALWMGVPVVTWPQSRVVSRQTAAFLSAIGLEDLIASSADEYLAIAARLASDIEGLRLIRSSMRERMEVSKLMDLAGFTRELENTLIGLVDAVPLPKQQKAVYDLA
jgi:protein O-GlcNAc transferase